MVTATLKATPGAKGKKGFLLWVTAAFPKAIADRAIEAAAKHVSVGMVGAANSAARGPAAGTPTKTTGGLGRLGDVSLTTIS